MKHLRRLLMFAAVLGIASCIILLLNFTAPNPTGRRYSSEPVDLSQNSQEKGATGERILSQDLRLPNNNIDGKKCLCGTNVNPPSNHCQTCIVRSDNIANYRIPDFVSDTFIADSKNTEKLLVTNSHDYPQIIEMVVAANQKQIPLWIYVRVDTLISEKIEILVHSTGGDIVPYFAVPGYVDPIDHMATIGIILFGGLFSLMLLWESLAGIQLRPAKTMPSKNTPISPTSPAPRPHAAITRAEKAIKGTERFMEDTENSARKTIDIENTRQEDDLI